MLLLRLGIFVKHDFYRTVRIVVQTQLHLFVGLIKCFITPFEYLRITFSKIFVPNFSVVHKICVNFAHKISFYSKSSKKLHTKFPHSESKETYKYSGLFQEQDHFLLDHEQMTFWGKCIYTG